MPTFVFYANEQRKLRSDGANFIIASGADVVTTHLSAEQLINDPYAFVEFKLVEFDDLHRQLWLKTKGRLVALINRCGLPCHVVATR